MRTKISTHKQSCFSEIVIKGPADHTPLCMHRTLLYGLVQLRKLLYGWELREVAHFGATCSIIADFF